MENNYNFKYIIVGDVCVGKSCLTLQYLDKRFEPVHDTTIGVEFGSKKICFFEYNADVKIQIWDTAGQETFRSIVRSYFRGAIGALVVFDITKRDTFNNIKSWLNQVKDSCLTPINITLVGNKFDLDNKRVVSREEALILANEYNINYIETSAKTGHNVDEAFNNNIKIVLERIKNGEIDGNFGIPKTKPIKQNKITNDNKCYCA
jgi:Ras-related protein Rab-2A